MSSAPLMSTETGDGEAEETMKSKLKKGCRSVGYCLGAVFLVIFIAAWIIQFTMYYWATTLSGCSPSKLEGYSYPGAEKSEAGDASWNLMPEISLLAERKPMWYGAAFDVIPSNEASNVASAPVGAWWQTWGPIFYTYTYEDVANSRTTIYMRRKLLRIGQCHVIGRCDGKGPTVTFTEGSNWFANRLRRFFRMNQGVSYKIYLDDELIGIAEETQHGFQSLTFRDKQTGEFMGSSVLKERHFHGDFDLWLVKNEEKDKLPYYVSSAATLLFAFHTLTEDARAVKSEHMSGKDGSPDSPKLFLAPSELGNSSIPVLSNSVPQQEVADAEARPIQADLHASKEVQPDEHQI